MPSTRSNHTHRLSCYSITQSTAPNLSSPFFLFLTILVHPLFSVTASYLYARLEDVLVLSLSRSSTCVVGMRLGGGVLVYGICLSPLDSSSWPYVLHPIFHSCYHWSSPVFQSLLMLQLLDPNTHSYFGCCIIWRCFLYVRSFTCIPLPEIRCSYLRIVYSTRSFH